MTVRVIRGEVVGLLAARDIEFLDRRRRPLRFVPAARWILSERSWSGGVETRFGGEQPGHVGADRRLQRFFAAAEMPSRAHSAERCRFPFEPQPAPFSKPQNRDVVLFEELGDPLGAGLIGAGSLDRRRCSLR